MTAWSTSGLISWRMCPGVPDTVEYLPQEPGPTQLETGRPAVLLLRGGDGFHVQLQVQWDPPSNALEALRAARERALGRPLRLAPPKSLQVHYAALELKGHSAPWRELQRVPTSGYPPYGAAFAVSLDADDGARMASALGGTHGLLAVRFRATTAGLELDRRADVASWFGAGEEVEALAVAANVRALSRAHPY